MKISNVSEAHAIREQIRDIEQPAAGGSTFGDTLTSLISRAAEALRESDTMATASIEGRVPLHQAVNSIMMAERELQAALAIRDKIVAAYQEISRISI